MIEFESSGGNNDDKTSRILQILCVVMLVLTIFGQGQRECRKPYRVGKILYFF